MKLTFPRHILLCLYATTATVLIIAFAPAAWAGQPECPCWEGQIGLAADLASHDLTICETHPIPVLNTVTGLHASRVVVGTFDEIIVNVLSDNSAFGPLCDAILLNGIEQIDLSKGVVWACMRDVGAVCRGLGF